MAQWLNWGDGHDGSPNSISGTINSYASMTGTSGGTTVTTSLSVSAGDQVLLHQTRHATTAGVWEIVKVASTGSGQFTSTSNLANSYSTGAQAVLIPQYTEGDIGGAVTGTAWNGTTGGIIALLSNGDLTISGSITAPGGFRGGAHGVKSGSSSPTGTQGEGNTGTGSSSKNANTNGGGGGGGWTYGGANPSGGGGGGNGATGTTGQAGPSGEIGGTGGSAVGAAALTTACFGAGGGGGADTDQNTGTNGAAGKGFVLIIAKNITITGTIPGTGASASNPGGSGNASGGGGGAGGSVLIKTQVAVLGTNKITASGGAGGDPSGSSYASGGAGSVGRIRCDYFTSVSGSTTPSLSSAQDTTLNVPASSRFFAFF